MGASRPSARRSSPRSAKNDKPINGGRCRVTRTVLVRHVNWRRFAYGVRTFDRAYADHFWIRAPVRYGPRERVCQSSCPRVRAHTDTATIRLLPRRLHCPVPSRAVPRSRSPSAEHRVASSVV